MEDEDLKVVEGSLFDSPITLFQHTENQMLSEIVSYVFDDVKARTYAYQKDKCVLLPYLTIQIGASVCNFIFSQCCRWLAVPSQKDMAALSLSESACEMMYVLRKWLLEVQDAITASLFTSFWQQLAAQLSKFIYTMVSDPDTIYLPFIGMAEYVTQLQG